MADTRSNSDKNAARNRANAQFAASERRDAAVWEIIHAERAAVDARSAKLRALRLAKEEADRIAAANAPKPAAPAPKPRKPRMKKVKAAS
ncbi:MAG TPA: hypothetical protein VGF62_09795 [Rhizomicrobium sp.]|jgi:hypothetical protein